MSNKKNSIKAFFFIRFINMESKKALAPKKTDMANFLFNPTIREFAIASLLKKNYQKVIHFFALIILNKN